MHISYPSIVALLPYSSSDLLEVWIVMELGCSFWVAKKKVKCKQVI